MLRKYPACLFSLLVLLALFLSLLLERDEEGPWERLTGQEVCLSGQVTWKEENRQQTILYLKPAVFCGPVHFQKKTESEAADKAAHGIFGEAGESLPAQFGVLCRVPKKELSSPAEEAPLPALGETVLVTGKLRPFRRASNPGEFDQQEYYRMKGLEVSLEKAAVQKGDGRRWRLREALYCLKKRLSHTLSALYDEKQASVMRAVLLGERASLDGELKALYQENGIAHILAISGLHISAIGMAFYRGLRQICPLPLAGAASGIILTGYVLMTGSSPSAWRALLLLGAGLLADGLGRSLHRLSALSLVAVCLLLYQPRYLLYAGFLLSFGVTAGILLFCPALRRLLPKWVPPALADGLGIAIVSLPMILWFYYEFPLYSLFLNLLVVPLMGVLLGFGLVSLLAGICFLPLGVLLALPVKAVLFVYEFLCLLTGALPGHIWRTGRPEAWQMALYFACLLLVAATVRCRRHCREGACLLLLLALSLPGLRLRPAFTLTMLDVGQGDGLVLESAGGRVCVIDGGSTSEKKLAEYRLLPFLKSRGVTRIDLWFLTHMDEDHISGAEEVLAAGKEAQMQVKALVLPRLAVQDEVYIRICREAGEAGISVYEMGRGDVLAVEGQRISCLNPGPEQGTDRNAASLAFLWEENGFSALFMGDVDGEAEEAVRLAYQALAPQKAVTLLKAGHHGSANACGASFLETVRPALTLISCGADNAYGHPAPDTLNRLKASGSRFFVTAERGALTVTVRRGQVWVEGYCSTRPISE